MGIERLQHAADRAVDQAIGLDLVHVARLDERSSAAVNVRYCSAQTVFGGGGAVGRRRRQATAAPRIVETTQASGCGTGHEEIVTNNLKASNDFAASARPGVP